MKNKLRILSRKVKKIINNMVIVYHEKYCIDQNGKEIYDENLVIENNVEFMNNYKNKIGLLTLNDLKEIRNKLGLSPKKYYYTIFQNEVKIYRNIDVNNKILST